MTQEFHIREYRECDEAKILELLDLVFDRKNSPDFWRWKYFDNPLKEHTIVVAEYDDQIVGCNHSYYCEVKIGKNMYKMAFAGDAAVHPDFRRRSIYSQILDLREDLRLKQGSYVSSGITTNPIVKKIRDKRGRIHFPKKIIQAIYCEDIWLEELFFLKKIGYQFYKSGQRILNSNIGESNKYLISEVEQFGSEADEFWEKIKNQYYFIFNRDASNLNWRYCDHRIFFKYKVNKVLEKGELLGYCVTAVRKTRDFLVGYVIDLCTLSDMDARATLKMKIWNFLQIPLLKS